MKYRVVEVYGPQLSSDIFQQAIRVQITLNVAKTAETVRRRVISWDTHANAHRSILGLTVALWKVMHILKTFYILKDTSTNGTPRCWIILKYILVNEELSARKIETDMNCFQIGILCVLQCWIVWRVTIATLILMISLGLDNRFVNSNETVWRNMS